MWLIPCSWNFTIIYIIATRRLHHKVNRWHCMHVDPAFTEGLPSLLCMRATTMFTSHALIGLLSSSKACSSSSTLCSRWSIWRFCERTLYSITLSLSKDSALALNASNTNTQALHILLLMLLVKWRSEVVLAPSESSCQQKRSAAVYNGALQTCVSCSSTTFAHSLARVGFAESSRVYCSLLDCNLYWTKYFLEYAVRCVFSAADRAFKWVDAGDGLTA